MGGVVLIRPHLSPHLGGIARVVGGVDLILLHLSLRVGAVVMDHLVASSASRVQLVMSHRWGVILLHLSPPSDAARAGVGVAEVGVDLILLHLSPHAGDTARAGVGVDLILLHLSQLLTSSTWVLTSVSGCSCSGVCSLHACSHPGVCFLCFFFFGDGQHALPGFAR